MDELIDILDSEGNFTGKTMMKSEAHKKGYFHPTVTIWCYNKKGEVLIQQRAHNKDTHPLLWDASVAGHIGAGEDKLRSAVREVEEEIGLKISEKDLIKIGVFKSVHRHHPTLIDCEFRHTFLCELKTDLENLTKQESEVKALALIPLSKFIEELHENSSSKKYVPHDHGYYETIIKAIEKRL
ncbi:NUDIX domain-containing protein [Arenibacter nanhaiticus]|uniref:NUDIX domain-containing protein n=1 Tax=Arenibacter nanhaiticus TaxID=558155 RepID=A0A1M6EI37_9FLAO|nr:NUDIX domain-containing protein [Arenibacter nanhaiticus]SHI85177.1 NUDIX domain-containing protein [Arenibacter nanhaiticus]